MATIYIVIGSTGEYADRSQWNVCFKSTEEEAEDVRKLCQAQADEYYDKTRREKRPQRSFLRRHSILRNEELLAEEKALRDAMFDKFFSCDYTGTDYRVELVGDEPATDPRWINHQVWWKNWQDERMAEQMKHCTLNDRSAFAKLGDLLRSRLTIK